MSRLEMARNDHDIKEKVHKRSDQMSGDAKAVYELAVRRAIERGIADADVGRSYDIKDVRKEFADKWTSDSRKRQEDISSKSSRSSQKIPRGMPKL